MSNRRSTGDPLGFAVLLLWVICVALFLGLFIWGVFR